MPRISRRHSRWYLLLIIALLIAFVVFQLLRLSFTNKPTDQNQSSQAVPQHIDTYEYDTDIDKYLAYISSYQHQQASDDYISGAVNYLTFALEELRQKHRIALNPSTLVQLQEQSKKISHSSDTDKTLTVSHTFEMISGVMQSIELNNSEQLAQERSNLRQMAKNFRDNLELEQQDMAISQFLAQAGLLLEILEAEG
ncbi:hypothetical protein PZB74_01160 [Porifericola rhodea]|uniref:hypothetical protein n=1 Tax=Porifericola rhodea TaxID=930972 RepID=UPI0026671AFE|nr:hypothetical protein [Porifericola rhodea]WKN31964.1 hypothetical protein PZB74_01160 [Porifericola rhodea]